MHSSGFEFNKEKMFLRFNGLMLEIIEKSAGTKTSKNKHQNYKLFQLYHDEFLFRSYQAYSILKRMRSLKENVLKPQFEGLKPHLNITDETKILFSSFVTREYIYFVMPFLNTLFILQDRIMLLLKQHLNIQFTRPVQKPDETDQLFKWRLMSFRDSIQKFSGCANNNFKILNKFPNAIQKLVKDYWNAHAENIRQYRNLDQHQYQMYYHSFYRLKPKEEYVLYLPDEITKNIKLHEITYNKKIVALDLFESEFRAFHDFVESMLKQIKVQPSEIQPGQSFSPLEGLLKYNNGDLLSTMVIGNEALTFRISKDNDLNSKAKRLELKSIPNRISSFNWEFK